MMRWLLWLNNIGRSPLLVPGMLQKNHQELLMVGNLFPCTIRTAVCGISSEVGQQT